MNDKPKAKPATELQLQRLTNFSPQRLDGVVDTTRLKHVQLGRGAFNGEVLRARSGNYILDSGVYTQSIFGNGRMPEESVTFGLIIPEQTGGIMEGCHADMPTPFCYTEAEELTVRLEAGTQWFTFQAPRLEVEKLAPGFVVNRGGIRVCEEQEKLVLIQQVCAVAAQFKQLAVNHACSDEKNVRLEGHFEELITAFVRALGPDCGPVRHSCARGHKRLVSNIGEYIHSHLAQPLRIADLCEISGVSYKTLERAFMGVYGVSPQRYISLTRLSHARRLLLNKTNERSRISDIALISGYTHFGRFSEDYRRLFGDLPSRTSG